MNQGTPLNLMFKLEERRISSLTSEEDFNYSQKNILYKINGQSVWKTFIQSE